jgi:cytoskeleton protein RodZ
MTDFQGALPRQGESMSEHDEGEGGFVSIGERLRRAREARAMTLDDVANQTRIPIRHLQHIETEEWDALPAPTYAIGFTRNYATAIGLDGPALANELRDQIGGPRRRAAPAPEYYEPADPARVPPKSLIIVVLVLAVLLVGGYVLWRNTLGADQGAAPEPVADVNISDDTAAPDNGLAATPEALTGQAVTLTALGDVWIRVTDGRGGPPLIAAMLNTGQTYTVPATAVRPLLRTANPQLLRASAAGRDLGLIGPTRRTVDNVSLLPADLAARAAGQPASPSPAAMRPGSPSASTLTPAPAPEQTPPPPTDAPLSAPLPQ